VGELELAVAGARIVPIEIALVGTLSCMSCSVMLLGDVVNWLSGDVAVLLALPVDCTSK
jgi:hypothetical protein